MEINGFEIKEFNVNGFELNGKINGIIQTTCVFCSSTRKKSKDKCCTVNLDKAFYDCHHCGKKRTTYTLTKRNLK